jgi:glycosyltransferase involved in cell wall biosynthesis
VKALIAADLAPMKIGSLEHQIFTVARLLEDAGIQVATSFSGNISEGVRDHFGLTQRRLHSRIGSLSSAAGRRAWLNHLTQEQADILWLHFFPPPGRFSRQVRRACPRARICFSDHVSRGYDSRGPLKEALCRLRATVFSGCVDRYIAVSEFVARRLEVNDFVPADRIRVVYNGIDLERFSPVEPSGSNVIAICNMIPQKGVPVLLNALAVLKARGTEPVCQLVGVGPHLEEYRAYARDRGLERIQFLGSRDDVPEILRNARVTVVPSVWEEAFGLAAAESMASGVPVVASSVGALPEIVDVGVTGVLVPPQDPKALADAILDVTTNPEKRRAMGQAAREKAERDFDSRRQCQRIADILLDRMPVAAKPNSEAVPSAL